jgi:isopentenyl diphosphate isomerase/L-lactate dehydrogenase-like FMN-dependent dehydrogenase
VQSIPSAGAHLSFYSGIRRGIDVFKALALGATAVAIGRPVLWGMAAGGTSGVKSVYVHLAGEIKSAMLLSGVAKATDTDRPVVRLVPKPVLTPLTARADSLVVSCEDDNPWGGNQ